MGVLHKHRVQIQNELQDVAAFSSNAVHLQNTLIAKTSSE